MFQDLTRDESSFLQTFYQSARSTHLSGGEEANQRNFRSNKFKVRTSFMPALLLMFIRQCFNRQCDGYPHRFSVSMSQDAVSGWVEACLGICEAFCLGHFSNMSRENCITNRHICSDCWIDATMDLVFCLLVIFMMLMNATGRQNQNVSR